MPDLGVQFTHSFSLEATHQSVWSTSKASTMADTDESAIHSSDATQIETDLSDETQDFRFLNNLSL